MKKIVVLVMALAMAGLVSLPAWSQGEEWAAPAEGEAPKAAPEEKVLFSFEKDTQGWEVPEWALEQQDYVGKSVEASSDFSKTGDKSLKLIANFPGKVWTAAIAEDFEYFDWTPYKEIACDVYIPKEAPTGLKAKLILTVGENWKFTEMSRSIPLVPGEWVTISASLVPGSEDWKKTVVDDDFRKDVRKLAVRIESNRQPVYDGPIYLDDFRVVRK
jgi:hypothetical protein